MILKRFFASIVLLLYLVSARPRLQRFTAAFWGNFDTVTVITAYSASQRQFDVAFEAAVNSFSESHRYYDRFSYSHDIVNIAYLNRHAAFSEVKTAPTLFSILDYGKEGIKRTDGLVDPTFGAVSSLWYEQTQKSSGARPPNREQLLKARHSVGENMLILDKEKSTVKLDSENAIIDVGAFAKGYAVEQAAAVMLSAGLNRCAISGGGNIKTLDPPDMKRYWNVGIQDPEEAAMQGGTSLGSILMNNMAVSTSGDYQRYFWSDGKRYHHLIDPETLYPAEYFRSVTVVCPNAADADLFSTALFVCDLERGKAMAEREGLAVLWVFENGEIYANKIMKTIMKRQTKIPR